MKAKGILLVTVVLLGTAGMIQAQEGQLDATLDVTYLNSYIWRGFDYFADDHGAILPTLAIDLYGTGFGVNISGARALSGRTENTETLSLGLNYSGSALEGETSTNYTVGWVYYGFPDEPRSTGIAATDTQELFASLSWPDIFPFGAVPSYTVLTMWPSEGNSAGRKNAGWAHVLGLDYDVAIPALVGDLPEQSLRLSAAVVYNDGVAPGVVVGPGGTGTVEHDWSHAVIGASTKFDLADNLAFTPGVYYQISMEDSVNTEDEAWFSLNMSYKF